ncbi:hypothetical protein JCM33374_g4390 [Metschnikowia sp. JCM 33374]|nr:hypothetical protein JCM33374_g4390 [Metschnikowia sp. JCM 33374]
MNVFATLIFFTWASAYVPTRIGALYISEIAGVPTDRNLRVINGTLFADPGFSKFQYIMGRIIWTSSVGDQYLKVENSGALSWSEAPHTGFFLKEEGDSGFEIRLTLNGDEQFEICGDGSVAYKSGCLGAQSIRINFEDI